MYSYSRDIAHTIVRLLAVPMDQALTIEVLDHLVSFTNLDEEDIVAATEVAKMLNHLWEKEV